MLERRNPGKALWYGIYRASDDKLLACGNAREFCKQMGFAGVESLHHLIWRVRKGTCKAYEIYTELWEEEPP